jgi:SAM-dependent methyltransferase
VNPDVRMDEINRRAWRSKQTLRQFARLEGWTDEGERVAFERIENETRGKPILDLGVGGGRTIPLLTRISEDYTGLDYTAEMVALARQRFPAVRVVHGDARDLSQFPEGSFSLVVFSFNGIDAVDHDARQRVLSEVHRVLRPGGIFLFSTHNQDGPGRGEPFRLLPVRPTWNPFRLGVRVLRSAVSASVGLRNHWRYRSLNRPGETFSIMNAAAHDYGIVIHYISLQAELRELEAAGFRPEPEVYESTAGKRVRPGDDSSQSWWFHLIARR